MCVSCCYVVTVQTLKLANSAVSGIDGLVSDVSGNIANVKREAGSSSKAAGMAIDSMVTRAIEKGQFVKETFAGMVVWLLSSAICTDTAGVETQTHHCCIERHTCQVLCHRPQLLPTFGAFMCPC